MRGSQPVHSASGAEAGPPAASFQRLAFAALAFGRVPGASHYRAFETLATLIRFQLASGGPTSPLRDEQEKGDRTAVPFVDQLVGTSLESDG